jgi:hypothetical protein
MEASLVKAALQQFRLIPGVGKVVAGDLFDLGIRSLKQLGECDPEQMYLDHCAQKGYAVDRCMLYTFRCAVYYCSTTEPDPELLKWWNWKDRTLN